jgi:NAD(P)-dependent dehydrogenase (short-subunit alcohol dehydrogenase family)
MSFEQATVLVTGGTSGIGRATAQLFGDRGAKVIVSGRDEDRGREAAAGAGGRFIRADLASPQDVRRLAGEDARPVTGTVLAVDAGRAAAL